MNTTISPTDLLKSLQVIRKYRRNENSPPSRKEWDALEKRITNIEKFLKNIPKENEQEAPDGFKPIGYFFKLRPDVSETQIRKFLDAGVIAGTIEVGRWRNQKTKLICKWYKSKDHAADNTAPSHP